MCLCVNISQYMFDIIDNSDCKSYIMCYTMFMFFMNFYLEKYKVLEISKNDLLKVQNIIVSTYGSNNKGLMEIIISSEAKKLFLLYSRFIPFPLTYL